MKKKVAGNVEFILAFVLFVSFTVAAIYFLNPIRNTQSLDFAREYVENAIVKNVSVEIETYSVKIDAPSSEKNIEVVISGVSNNKNVRVVNYSGGEMSSKRGSNGKKVCFTRENNEDFAVIYLSEDFSGDEGACTGNRDNDIASSSISEVISEKRLASLGEMYESESGYALLAEQFKIPRGMDFAFSLGFPKERESISAEKKIPLRREVFSETKTVEVLRKSGELKFGYLTVKVW